MSVEPVVEIAALSHHFGSGALKKQILHDVSLTVDPGEIVILTGPSGSGKTTLLTLIGALRSAQQGSLRILGQEIRDARPATLVNVRRRIGYIFQLHNLLDALTVRENVQMGLQAAGLGAGEAAKRAQEVLESVGLGEHTAKHPDQLSGGQRQRVAIARALASRPRIILADEPTASLDKRSGREVVDRLHDLAKREGTAVLLVTHDNRILDIADRIIHLEEGRLSSFADAVMASTQQLLLTLAKAGAREAVVRQVAEMSPDRFRQFVERITSEAQQLMQSMAMSTDETFERMLEQVLEACTYKVGQLAQADRASVLLADRARGELWSKVAQSENERPVDIRIPIGSGIAGHVFASGEPMNLPDAYASPLFNPEVDRATGYRTRSILCVPLLDRVRRPFAVMTLLNKRGGESFSDRDAQALSEFGASIGVMLEIWNETRASRAGRAA
jgi:putative ABC transport system ATP-binding protein